MDQYLKAIPNTHMAVHNYLIPVLSHQALSDLLVYLAHIRHTYICASKIPTHMKPKHLKHTHKAHTEERCEQNGSKQKESEAG